MSNTQEGLSQNRAEIAANQAEDTKETLSQLSVGELEGMEEALSAEWQQADAQEGQAFTQLEGKYSSLAAAERSGDVDTKLTPEQKKVMEEVGGTPDLAKRKAMILAIETSGVPFIDGMMKKIQQVMNSLEYNAAIQAQKRKEEISTRRTVVSEARQIAVIRERAKAL